MCVRLGLVNIAGHKIGDASMGKETRDAFQLPWCLQEHVFVPFRPHQLRGDSGESVRLQFGCAIRSGGVRVTGWDQSGVTCSSSKESSVSRVSSGSSAKPESSGTGV